MSAKAAKIILISLFLFLLSYTCFARSKTIILATTTSVEDSGLLDVLMQAFKDKTGLTVKAIAVGTGQAIKLGENGEADILWVHSPQDEEKFILDGYGINRTTFLHNDFVILGPKNDPAKVATAKNAGEAFKKIAAAEQLFISRGDNSGTHKKEKKLWEKSGAAPDKNAYIEVGQGMAQTAMVANEKQAYTLCDRSTYLSLKKTFNLGIVFAGSPDLINRYSLILVNPDRFPKVNAVGGRALFDFLLSSESKNIIENFGREKFGQQLFYPDARKPRP